MNKELGKKNIYLKFTTTKKEVVHKNQAIEWLIYYTKFNFQYACFSAHGRTELTYVIKKNYNM